MLHVRFLRFSWQHYVLIPNSHYWGPTGAQDSWFDLDLRFSPASCWTDLDLDLNVHLLYEYACKPYPQITPRNNRKENASENGSKGGELGKPLLHVDKLKYFTLFLKLYF